MHAQDTVVIGDPKAKLEIPLSRKMDSTRISSALQLVQVAVDKWELVQVELQGKYSLARMRAFHAYASQSRWYRIFFWYIVTPIPCLVINILLDIAPLAPPSAGRDANYVFWVRLTAFTTIGMYWVWMQTGSLTPALGMKPWHALSGSMAVAISCTMSNYILAGFIPMPIPFLLLAETPPFTISNAIMIGCYFGRKLINNAELRASFNRALNTSSLQIALVYIYPAFIFGFNSIPSEYQPLFMILMPVIKIVSKNILSRLVASNDDLKSVEIVFNIDCFTAIYVSLAMQRATTLSTSLMVMLIDIVQGCVSVYDVYQGFQPLKRFMDDLPPGHPLHGKNFLEVAIALDQESEFGPRDKQTLNETLSGPTVQTKPIKSPRLSISSTGLRSSSTKVFVAPRQAGNQDISWNMGMQQNPCSSESRVAFLLASRKLLFTTEFVILVEYTEVIIPVLYSFLMAASYHLPNRAFYSTIADIDEQKLWSVFANVIMYAALELMSLLLMGFVLRRITRVSPMCQAGFVLGTKRVQVQSKMLSWVLYAVQNSLDHFGADFSFKFKWLRSH